MAKLASSSWKNKQIQRAHVFYFQWGKIKHEIDFSSPSVEGGKHISNQALKLQPFLINLLHHVLKPTDFIFCCNLHTEVWKHWLLFLSEDDFLLLQIFFYVSCTVCAQAVLPLMPLFCKHHSSEDLLKPHGWWIWRNMWRNTHKTLDEVNNFLCIYIYIYNPSGILGNQMARVRVNPWQLNSVIFVIFLTDSSTLTNITSLPKVITYKYRWKH